MATAHLLQRARRGQPLRGLAGTANLPGGQITVQGLVVNRDLRVLPITGGSSQYQGADGEMHARFAASGPRAVLTFHLED